MRWVMTRWQGKKSEVTEASDETRFFVFNARASSRVSRLPLVPARSSPSLQLIHLLKDPVLTAREAPGINHEENPNQRISEKKKFIDHGAPSTTIRCSPTAARGNRQRRIAGRGLSSNAESIASHPDNIPGMSPQI